MSDGRFEAWLRVMQIQLPPTTTGVTMDGKTLAQAMQGPEKSRGERSDQAQTPAPIPPLARSDEHTLSRRRRP